jgi:PBP1b-binding outer membrane lipoprotein LpoB
MVHIATMRDKVSRKSAAIDDVDGLGVTPEEKIGTSSYHLGRNLGQGFDYCLGSALSGDTTTFKASLLIINLDIKCKNKGAVGFRPLNIFIDKT